MLLALCVLVYAGLPAAVAWRCWHGGRRILAAVLFIAALAVPLLVGWVALQSLNARLPPARSSGEALDAVVTAAQIGLGTWLALCVAAWFVGSRPGAAPDPPRAR